MGADLLQAADEHAEAGGVEELDRLEVDHDVVGAGVDELGDAVAQLGCGVDVDLAADRDDGATIDLACGKGEIHVCSPVPECSDSTRAGHTACPLVVPGGIKPRVPPVAQGPQHLLRPRAGCRRRLPDSARESLPPRRAASGGALSVGSTGVPGREDRLRHLEVLPAREAVHEDWPAWVPRRRTRRLRRPGRRRARGATRSSPPTPRTPATTSSSPPARPRGSRWPTSCRRSRRSAPRAASARRARRLRALPRPHQGAGPRPARRARVARASTYASPTHDGDSSREERDWARDYGEYVLTNPDMLHRSLLPGPPPLGAVARLAAVRRGRRVPPLPRRVRGARRPRAAPAAAGVRDVRRPPDVRARLGDRRRAGGDGRRG